MNCQKHNKSMLPSKFGGFWCPDCHKEKQANKGQGNLLLMEEIAGINQRLDKLIAFVVSKLK